VGIKEDGLASFVGGAYVFAMCIRIAHGKVFCLPCAGHNKVFFYNYT
jgi:hypothetical protein